MNVERHVSQNALFPIETAGPFLLIGPFAQSQTLPPVDDCPGAAEAKGHVHPLVIGNVTGVGQLTGQRHAACFLWWDDAVN